jgi:hypothetical protein
MTKSTDDEVLTKAKKLAHDEESFGRGRPRASSARRPRSAVAPTTIRSATNILSEHDCCSDKKMIRVACISMTRSSRA